MLKLRIDSNALKHAFNTAVAMSMATVISLRFHFGAPYWSVISVIAITSLSQKKIFEKGINRIIGTIFGAMLGYVSSTLFDNNIISLIAFVFVVSYAGFILMHYFKFNYAIVFSVGTAILVFSSMVGGTGAVYNTAIWRTTEIIVGVICATLVSFLCFKDNEASLSKTVSAIYKKIYLHSLKAASSITLSVAAWLFFGWPGGLQGIISSFIILIETEFDMATAKALRRLLGCILGGGIGIFCLHFLAFNIYDLITLIFGFGFIFSYFSTPTFEHNYLALQANVAFSIALIQAGGPTLSIAPSLERLSGIILGILSAFIINLVFYERPKYTAITPPITRGSDTA